MGNHDTKLDSLIPEFNIPFIYEAIFKNSI
jgi:hypothetical protein